MPTLSPEQIIALVSAVLTGALGAFVTVTTYFLRFIREERRLSEKQVELFVSSMDKASAEFVAESKGQAEQTRALIYRIVEQRDKDIERVTNILAENSNALARMEHTCGRLNEYLIQRNAHGLPARS